jgi:xanthine dehydrogenase accessory factor
MTAGVMVRGGGDLASGVALRLHRAGLPVLVTELPAPLVVRRLVAFAEAVYAGEAEVEGQLAVRVEDIADALVRLNQGVIPVLVDPQLDSLEELRRRFEPLILVDARMTKCPPDRGRGEAELVIGLGPGFTAGDNCDAVVETNRGHNLGRVIWQGSAEQDTGIPEQVARRGAERVLRAPVDGALTNRVTIGERVEADQPVAEVGDQVVRAPFAGVVRGLLHPRNWVQAGLKIADIDPRDDPSYARLVSDKSLAVGGGVLEAILSVGTLRKRLWGCDAAG